jgi:hypothetical protein
VAAVGAWVFVQPYGLKEFADLFLTPGGLWFAVALRLTMGALLWICASASRTPIVIRVLGAMFFLSGLALAIVGLDRMAQIAEWGVGLDPSTLRGVGLMAAALGAFIVWSIWPRRSEG